MRRVARRVLPAVQVLVSVGILTLLVARLGTGTVADALRAIDVGPVLAALGIGLVTTVLHAWRWCLVARGLGLRLRLSVAVADCYRALLLNSVLPAGVLGDVHRGVSHGLRNGDVGRGIGAVALERAAGHVVLVLVGVVVLLVQPTLLAVVVDRLGATAHPGLWLVVLSVVGFVLGVAAAVAVRRIRRAVRDAASEQPGTPKEHSWSRRIWPAVLLLSLGALAGYLTLFVVAARAAGDQTALGELLPLLVVSLAAMGLPLNVGGWGPREAVAAAAFAAVGLDAARGLTVAMVYGVLSLVACLPGTAVLVLHPVVSRVARGQSRSVYSRPSPPGGLGGERV